MSISQLYILVSCFAYVKYFQKSANKDGAISDRRVGPAASRRLYEIFMGTDPTSTDV